MKKTECIYNEEEKEIINLERAIELLQLKKLKKEKKLILYENQKEVAREIISKFRNRKIINTMVIAKTQSGKTGSMCAAIKFYLEDTNILLPITNIYIITGLSSLEWKTQTKERFPESIQKRIYQ